jgi:hypothetical protein
VTCTTRARVATVALSAGALRLSRGTETAGTLSPEAAEPAGAADPDGAAGAGALESAAVPAPGAGRGGRLMKMAGVMAMTIMRRIAQTVRRSMSSGH